MPRPIDPLVAEIVELLGEDLREEFEERAAIVEYDGNFPRAHAECLALLDVLHRHPDSLMGLTVLQMRELGETYWLLTTDPAVARRYVADRGGEECGLGSLIKALKDEYGGMVRLVPVVF